MLLQHTCSSVNQLLFIFVSFRRNPVQAVGTSGTMSVARHSRPTRGSEGASMRPRHVCLGCPGTDRRAWPRQGRFNEAEACLPRMPAEELALIMRLRRLQ